MPHYIDVPPELSGRVTHALRVTGRSLEPIFFDGDCLLLESASTLAHGDLGAFLIDGSAHVRWFYDKNGVKKLIPLCIDIPEIAFTDRILCLGRVLGSTKAQKPPLLRSGRKRKEADV